MSVKLRKRKNANGTTSLMLDIYSDGERKYEFLKHLQLSSGTTIADREANKERLREAEKIAVTRAAELEANNYNMVSDAGKKTIIIKWMQDYVSGYTKKDKRNMQGALNRFADFLKEEKKNGLTFGQITPLLIEDFIEYLEAHSEGEGASSYYNRFKKMIKHAYRKRLMKESILDLVQKRVKGKAAKKDILTLDELKALAATPTESSEVRRAFLFSCVTGLRWIDVTALQWVNINLKEKTMNLKQSKTGEEIGTPLNDTAIKLLGKPGKPESKVFALPTANGANKTVKAWVKRAGIAKKITWHNARHSFGTNLIYNDVDVLTASKLLGHTSLKHTQRYVDTANEMKQRATNKVNIELA